ncbi:MAG TPA: hypothetical protein PLH39_08285, partial [Promineifilum sp.]|nr:hypothetical protein [Promineifilum sp.]
MRSLTLKLVLAFLTVGLAGVVLVAVVIRRQTLLEFDRFIVDQYQAEIIARAADYYTENGSLSGVESVLRTGRRGGPGGGPGGARPLLVTDTEGQVVASTGNTESGVSASTIDVTDSHAVPVLVDGTVIGYVDFLDMPEADEL